MMTYIHMYKSRAEIKFILLQHTKRLEKVVMKKDSILYYF